jgi:hypothetical protein
VDGKRKLPFQQGSVKFGTLLAILLVTGCTAFRTTSPKGSAEQELLISTAADRAAEALAAQVPVGLSAWIDTGGLSRRDHPYAIAAIQDALLRRGVSLVADRASADAVILPRAGMLSTEERSTFVGIPALPLPLAPGVVMPPLSLYSQNKADGAAKFAASVYDTKSGKLLISTDPSFGFSHQESGTVLFAFTWRKNDAGVSFQHSPPRVTAPQVPRGTNAGSTDFSRAQPG